MSRWQVRRRTMVREQLRARGVRDARVLGALERVPRELFVPRHLRHYALHDRALSIGHGQTISQPYMVAVMTRALEVGPGQRVLEIGTGSGYQAAVLSSLGADVHSVELVPELAAAARGTLDETGFGDVRVRTGDGSVGWPEMAPFQRILVAAAAPAVPPSLLDQLDPEGGRLVAPVGPRDIQRLVVVERMGTERTTQEVIGCRFVPLLGREGWDA